MIAVSNEQQDSSKQIDALPARWCCVLKKRQKIYKQIDGN
jgi:hypothetical protein